MSYEGIYCLEDRLSSPMTNQLLIMYEGGVYWGLKALKLRCLYITLKDKESLGCTPIAPAETTVIT